VTDTVTKARRSEIMAAVRGKDTKPERKVRSFLHSNGLRYRLHAKDLPGKPDLVFPKYRTVVFINGCFWHGHADCQLARMPKSNVKFWNDKIQANKDRDKMNNKRLRALDWRVITVWECKLSPRDLNRLMGSIKKAGTRIDPAAHPWRKRLGRRAYIK